MWLILKNRENTFAGITVFLLVELLLSYNHLSGSLGVMVINLAYTFCTNVQESQLTLHCLKASGFLS
jgi:hypothetical protein